MPFYEVKILMRNAKFELFLSDLNTQGCILCPNPLADMKLWNTHPRVSLDVLSNKDGAQCPYCGTVYKLKTQFKTKKFILNF